MLGVICLEQRTRGAAQPAWPLLQQRPCARPAALRLPHGCQGERPEPQGKLASRNLSGSHASAYAARWTSPCVQATRHKLELGRLAFDLALKRRQAEVPKDYDLIVWLLRQLISTCTHHMRHEAKHYFEVARDELEPFSPASCPMSKDELHWFATQASSRP